MTHDNFIWIETGYDRDGNLLWQTEWEDRPPHNMYAKRNTAEWRAFGHLVMGNYTITHTDRNTMEMKRLDPERVCQTLVFSRKAPILFPDQPAGWTDPTNRDWPQEQIPK